MAEMTAAESVALLKLHDTFVCENGAKYKICDIQAKQIAALIEQQAAEIAKLKKPDYGCDLMSAVVRDLQACFDAKENVKWQDTKVIADMMRQQQQEIAKKDKMLEVSCQRLEEYSDQYYGLQRNKEQWLAWLEKEAEGVSEGE